MMRRSDSALGPWLAAVEAWGIGTFEWNHVDGLVNGCSRFFELYGMPAERCSSEMLWASVHEMDRARTQAAFDAARDPTGDGRVDLIHRVLAASGQALFLHLRAQTRFELIEGERRPLATRGSVLDVTALERTQERLQHTEARFDEAVRGAQFGIFEHSHLDDPAAENVYWSPRLREIFGFGPDEPGSARRLLSRVPLDDVEMLHAAVARAHDPKGDGYYDVEHRYLHPTLGLRWLLTRSSTYFGEVNGRRVPVRTVGAVIDISRERQLEENMRQAQKMEAVGRLAGGIAHDFNNILSAILSFAYVAIEDVGEAGRGYSELQEIIAAGKRAAGLTQQLLAFGRKQVLRPRVIDVRETITHLAPMLRRLVGEHIEVALALEPSTLRVKVDPTHLEQVLLNLAINARDAMEDGGRISIQSRTLSLCDGHAARTGLEPGPYVVVTVSDDGVGMDAETKAHVFEPFFTTKSAGRGSGLGLATVFGIVKQSGGNVFVESDVGRGSTFHAFFPASSEPLTQPEVDAPLDTDADAAGNVILVAEDDPAVRHVVVTILARAGYRAIGAAGPLEALALARETERPLDLLITDIVMPQLSGTELAERLRAVHPKLPVIYMSGYTDKHVFDRGLLDAGHFLPKPIIPARLLDTIARVLSETPLRAAG